MYTGLLAMRLALTGSPAYVHPDEVMQSVEVSSATVFDYHANVPWEWSNCTNPARSSTPQYVFRWVFGSGCGTAETQSRIRHTGTLDFAQDADDNASVLSAINVASINFFLVAYSASPSGDVHANPSQWLVQRTACALCDQSSPWCFIASAIESTTFAALQTGVHFDLRKCMV